MESSPECVDAMGLAYEIDFPEVYHTRTGGRHPSLIRFRKRRGWAAGGVVAVVLRSTSQSGRGGAGERGR